VSFAAGLTINRQPSRTGASEHLIFVYFRSLSVGHLREDNKSSFREVIKFGTLVPAATGSFAREKQFIRSVLELFNRDLSTRVGL
jgi:hypothetical protein